MSRCLIYCQSVRPERRSSLANGGVPCLVPHPWIDPCSPTSSSMNAGNSFAGEQSRTTGARGPGWFSCCANHQTLSIGIIREKRASRLKEVDTLIPIGVVSKGSKPGGQHVHESVVSRVSHSRLQVLTH